MFEFLAITWQFGMQLLHLKRCLDLEYVGLIILQARFRLRLEHKSFLVSVGLVLQQSSHLSFV